MCAKIVQIAGTKFIPMIPCSLDVSDASAPRPSLQSVESQASLDISAADVPPPDGVFDEEGLLFGDSECTIPMAPFCDEIYSSYVCSFL